MARPHPGFVHQVRARRRCVLGVFDPDESAGREHLATLGVDAVIASDAPISDLVELLASLTPPSTGTASDDHSAAARSVVTSNPVWAAPVVVGGVAGAGVSEVALAFAVAAAAHRRTVLIDACDDSPSLAARLGLGLEPNVRTAVDAVEHDLGNLERALVRVSPRLQVVPGFPSTAGASQVLVREVISVVDAIAATNRVTVVDVGHGNGEIGRAVVRAAGSIVFVLPATPIGVTRTLAWAAGVRGSLGDVPVHLVANRAPRDRFRRSELAHELSRTFTPTALWWIPTDRRVDDAMWRATTVSRGPFADAIASLVTAAVPSGDLGARAALTRSTRARATRAAEAGGMTADAYDAIRHDVLAQVERRQLRPEGDLDEVKVEVQRAVDEYQRHGAARRGPAARGAGGHGRSPPAFDH